jgi:hypothetical protein
MEQPSFQTGDRVKLRYTRGVVPAGATGTVKRIFYALDVFDVAFDGQVGFKIVWEHDLERADDPPALERAVGAG